MATCYPFFISAFMVFGCVSTGAAQFLPPPIRGMNDEEVRRLARQAQQMNRELAPKELPRYVPTEGFTAKAVGLPAFNTRSSEMGDRFWKVGPDGKTKLPKQPAGYPLDHKPGYEKKNDEIRIHHKGIDIRSREVPGGDRKCLPFTAGVHGLVIRDGGGSENSIEVKLHDGTIVTYRHASVVKVKKGAEVTPTTVIGVTGGKGAGGIIHLHIEAKLKDGTRIHPDIVHRIGQVKLQPEDRTPSASSKPVSPNGGAFVGPANRTVPPPPPPPGGATQPIKGVRVPLELDLNNVRKVPPPNKPQ